MTEQLSRRSLMLTGAADLALGALPTLPALAFPTPATLSLLILEHRRRAEHMFQINDLFNEWFDASLAALRAEFSDPDEVFEASLIARGPWLERLRAAEIEVAAVSRQIWRQPLQTYDDLAVQAEIALFWSRRGVGAHVRDGDGQSDESFVDPFAVADLARAVLTLADHPPEIVAYELPELLRARRGLDQSFCFKNCTDDEMLLATVTPPKSWSDIATLAELVMHHQHFYLCPSVREDERPEYCRLLTWKSAAEFLFAALGLAEIPVPAPEPRRVIWLDLDEEIDDEFEEHLT